MRWRNFATVIFDCDSTLSEIEGIDELAVILDKKEEIVALTDAAMNGDIDLSEVYGKRLEILRPTKQQVIKLKQSYKKHAVPHARKLVDLLNVDHIDSWIISGGLQEPVEEFGVWLGIEALNVKAVGSLFDPLGGAWWKSNEKEMYMDFIAGNLTASVGKGDVIKDSVTSKGKKIMFGDGVSDFAAIDSVDLFVAFAGVINRPSVTSKAQVVIESRSLAPAAALILGPARIVELLDSSHKDLAEACIAEIKGGAIRFNNREIKNKFMSSFEIATRGC